MPLAATIFIKTLFSFFATVAFGKLFNCPRSCLYKAGFVGMVGFGVYIILLSGFGLSSMLSNFAGTVALSICSEIFARWYKQPVPIFSIPGSHSAGPRAAPVPGHELYHAGFLQHGDAYVCVGSPGCHGHCHGDPAGFGPGQGV
jgi:hypothetical protein